MIKNCPNNYCFKIKFFLLCTNVKNWLKLTVIKWHGQCTKIETFQGKLFFKSFCRFFGHKLKNAILFCTTLLIFFPPPRFLIVTWEVKEAIHFQCYHVFCVYGITMLVYKLLHHWIAFGSKSSSLFTRKKMTIWLTHFALQYFSIVFSREMESRSRSFKSQNYYEVVFKVNNEVSIDRHIL